jgi:predicted nucleotidyltransferase component of viral defense system
MKLHLDKDAFTALLRLGSAGSGVRLDVLEKDYYITLMLEELAGWQEALPAYFKGGTALYKALGSIRRFSEDIDITVCIDGCSNSQAKRRLEKAASGYKSLPRTTVKELESNQKGSITSVYDYESILGMVIPDPLQRFSHVKVEATSFTVSEPFAPLNVAPLVYDRADESQKAILREQYDVRPFSINTILLERIFVDKLFAAEFYNERQEYFDVSKHIYDLSVMASLPRLQKLLADPDELTAMMDFKRREEKARIGSDLSTKPVSEFTIFEAISGNEALQDAFTTMQNIYIFDGKDRLHFENITTALLSIRDYASKEICD